IIGMVSLFSDISTEMAYPLLPLFIRNVLGASTTQLGIIEGIAEGTGSIITGLSGWISDRLHRRKWVAVLGYGATALAKPIVGLAGGVGLVLTGRFLDRFGKGVRSAPKDALLADVASSEMRGRIFGFERMMDSAGAVMGPAVSLTLLYVLSLSLRTALILTVVPSIAAFSLILLVAEPRSVASSARRFDLKGLSGDFLIFLAVNSLFNIGNSSNTFLLLKAADAGMGVTASLVCYMVYNAVYSLGSYPAGTLSDRLGRKNILMVGFFIFSAVYFGFALAGSKGWIWFLFIAYGLYPALPDGVSKALAVDTVDASMRATAIGIFSASVGFSRLIASVIGGWLWERFGSAATFYYGAVASMLALILFVIFQPQRTRSSQR